MRFGVLGPLAVWADDGSPVAVPGRKVRALLADLLVHEGRAVGAGRLIDDIWGDCPPPTAQATLAAKVSQLRRALDDAEPGGRELLTSGPGGYALRLAPGAVDAQRFQTLLTEARAAEPRTAASLLAEALDLWRGPAFADVADEQFVMAATAQLDEQRLLAIEERSERRLELGDHADLVGELTALVAEHPLRERLRACAMRALYGAGRQNEALETYRDLREQLADELGLDPGPELAALHDAILARDPSLEPPASLGSSSAAAASRTGNLPAPRTGLIGRDAAIAEVRSRLTADRLVTLTGPGGVGKTRLALAVAAACAPDFADGAWLVELVTVGGTTGPDASGALADAVLAALDVRDTAAQGEPVEPVERLGALLGPRQLLLLLDNCEHVIDAAAELADRLLAAAPGLRVLATSREPLALTGESVFGVLPLDVPVVDPECLPEQVERSPAVQLFVARAAAATTGFRLDGDTAGDVAELCRSLDGLPLALELAATRVRTLGVRGVVARLDDRFRLLVTQNRGAPPRQQTLQAMLDWSWELLTEPEQVLLRRLAVHAGSVTAGSAAAVAGGVVEDDVAGVAVARDAPLDPVEVPDLLARLVDRSLVELVPEPVDGAPRYRQLESVVAYSTDKLRGAGEEAALRDRHADHYLTLAEELAGCLRGQRQQAALRRLDAESANLRAALATASGDPHPDPQRALRLAAALAWYWVLRGRLGEARRCFEMALAVSGPAPAGLRERVVAWRAGVALLQGDPKGTRLYADAVDGLDAIDDPAARAWVEWFLADSGSLADVASTEPLLARALATSRSCGDRWVEAAAHVSRARLAHIRGDTHSVQRDAERAAELFELVGDRWGRLQASRWLGGHAELVGDYRRAAAMQADALRWAEELELWPDVSTQCGWLGWLAMEDCDYGRARSFAERGLALAAEQGFREGQVFASILLGYTARWEGRLDEAERHLRGLLDQTSGRADPEVHVTLLLSELAYVAELRGDPIVAARMHEEAFDLALKLGAARDTAGALEGMASALAAAGAHAAAAVLLGAASAVRDTSGIRQAPNERRDAARATATTQAALGRAAWTAAFEKGANLDPDTARARALRDLPV